MPLLQGQNRLVHRTDGEHSPERSLLCEEPVCWTSGRLQRETNQSDGTEAPMLKELARIISDIKSGNLRWNEIPGFVLWLIGRSFWLWIGIICIGFGLFLMN